MAKANERSETQTSQGSTVPPMQGQNIQPGQGSESARASSQEREGGTRGTSMARRDVGLGLNISPFSMVRRFAEQMDRFFEDFGMGRGLLSPFGLGQEMQRGGMGLGQALWVPDVEVFQRGNELVIRADLPGLSKEDVQVEITDDAVTISGERKYEQEENRRGVYRAERAYGFFQRTIPLPEGVSADEAQATFKNGVLEIVLKAPEQAQQGRRLEIKEGDQGTSQQPTTRH